MWVLSYFIVYSLYFFSLLSFIDIPYYHADYQIILFALKIITSQYFSILLKYCIIYRKTIAIYFDII